MYYSGMARLTRVVVTGVRDRPRWRFGCGVRRVVLVLLAWAAVVNVGGCSAFRAWQLGRGRPTVSVTFDAIEYRGVGPMGLEFNVPLEIHNETKGRATLTDVSLVAELNDRQIASANPWKALHIQPLARQVVGVPVYISPAQLVAGAWKSTHKLVFRGQGTVDLGVLGHRKITFNSGRILFSGEHGKLSLKRISMRKSRLTALCLTLDLEEPKVPDDPIRQSSLSAEIFLNDVRVAKIDQVRTVDAKGLIRVEVRIPTLSSAVVIGRIIKARKFDLRIEGLYSAETQSLKYRIPVTFARKGISF